MRRALGAIGRVLVTVGLLLLLFVVYQLWGTGIYQARAQSDLQHQFDQALRTAGVPSTTAPSSTPTTAPATTTTTRPLPPTPANGNVLARLSIPAIGVDQLAVEGVDVDDLTKGPGHYPTTQLPGHEGNSAFAGHRTTYGHPFGNLDQLRVGDKIDFVLLNGARYTYKVTEQRVVSPTAVSVLDPTPDPNRPGHSLATLTLTTCNPKYSAAQRLVIRAQLQLPEGQTVPLPPAAVPRGKNAGAINGLSGDPSALGPTVLWGAIALVIGLGWWLLFHRHPRWTTWLVGAIPFFILLFIAYTQLEQLLPSNY
jgi:sortase A